MNRSTLRILLSAWLGMLLCIPAPGWAQSPTAKTLHLVVPFTPGSGTDLLARALTPHLSEALGQPVVVDNRTGAGGTLAADSVAKAPADGSYILMGGSSVMTVAPNIYGHLPYDPVRDFAPVGLLTREPFWVLVRNSLPVNSMQELLALAKAHPGQLNCASYGTGTLSHLAAELLQSAAGIRMTHVPYKGQAPALNDLMGGQVDVMVTTLSSSMPLVLAGKLKAIAVTTATRLPQAPTVPTLGESGVALEIVGWIGAFVPAATSPAVIARLSAELARINRLPEIREGREASGAQAVTSTPQELSELVAKDLALWGQAAKAAGNIRID